MRLIPLVKRFLEIDNYDKMKSILDMGGFRYINY